MHLISLRYGNGRVTVTRALEPSQIFFENLHLTDGDKLKIRSLSEIVMIVVLVISFGAVYGLKLGTITTKLRW